MNQKILPRHIRRHINRNKMIVCFVSFTLLSSIVPISQATGFADQYKIDIADLRRNHSILDRYFIKPGADDIKEEILRNVPFIVEEWEWWLACMSSPEFTNMQQLDIIKACAARRKANSIGDFNLGGGGGRGSDGGSGLINNNPTSKNCNGIESLVSQTSRETISVSDKIKYHEGLARHARGEANHKYEEGSYQSDTLKLYAQMHEDVADTLRKHGSISKRQRRHISDRYHQGLQDRNVRRDSTAFNLTFRVLSDYHDIYYPLPPSTGTNQEPNPLENPPARDNRCGLTKTEQGRLFACIAETGGDLRECTRRMTDAIYDISNGNCWIETGPDDAERLACVGGDETEIGGGDPDGPNDDPGCDSPGAIGCPGDDRTIGVGFVENSHIGHLLMGLCQQGGEHYCTDRGQHPDAMENMRINRTRQLSRDLEFLNK